MPELPEVETVVRQLADPLPGQLIRKVRVIHPDLLREPPAAFRRALEGSTVESVSRRGKNIVLALSGSCVLVVNLGMTGQLLFIPSSSEEGGQGADEEPSHPGVIFTLETGTTLLYADTRRFGFLCRFDLAAWERESARLGPEPLDPELTPERFCQDLARSRSPIRSWLLDQTRIAGVGNIYASEALFRAELHPSRSARSLKSNEAARLLAAIREVLSDAILARGTTLRDYRTATGDRGGFGPSLQAYGRQGAPCPRCNTPIERIVFANRSAFFCPHCQSSV